MKAEVHVIPVWPGMTPEQSFDEIETFGRIVEYRWWWRFTRRVQWATIHVDADGTKSVIEPD